MVPQQYEDSFSENNFPLVLPIFIFLISAAIALGGFLFWLWMLIDCAMKETDEGNSKLVWVLIILFVNFLGALAYFFIRRPQRLRELGQ
ncbi:MAG: PLDc_N domain-containing protein [Cyanobacteria bacterium Co-bin8]|nr:PLDc_N domain-containing protein [Cyanobacteria bacterium Co-bin8]